MFGRSQQLFLDRYHSLNWQRELCELNWQTECMVIHFTPSPSPPLPSQKKASLDGYIIALRRISPINIFLGGGGGGGGGRERVVNSS